MITKPTVKSRTATVVKAISVGVGVKLADGVSAIMPSSTNSYKNYLLAALGLIGAASIDAKKPMGEQAQLALLGFGGKPLYDEITARSKEAIAPQDPTTVTGKFFNAFIGHKDEPTVALNNPVNWIGKGQEDIWNRTQSQVTDFTGV